MRAPLGGKAGPFGRALPGASLLLAALLALAWPASAVVPSAVADAATVSPGASALIDVLGNDLGSGLVLDTVGPGLLGAASVESGQVRYVAGPDEGSDVLAYTAHDGSLVPYAGVLTVTVLNQPPTLVLGGDPSASGHAGPVSLPAWATIDAGSPDESGQVLTTSIIDVVDPGLFDAGPDLASDGTLSFTPHPGAKGSTQATAVVEDDGPGDNTRSGTFAITITDDPPAADFFLPTGLVPHAPGSFVDTTADDGVLSWSWDFGDGATSTEQFPTHAYDSSGSYLVQLDVTDDAGQADHVEGTVVVDPAALQADFFLVRRAPVGDLVSVDDESTGGEGPLDVTWTFDDGAVEHGASATHAFAEPGVHDVTLDVTDGASTHDSLTQSITIYDTGGGSAVIAPGFPAHFTAGDVDVTVLSPAGSPPGTIDLAFALSPAVSGVSLDSLPALDAGHRTGLLYLEGVAGPLHDPSAVGQVQLTFHYAGLGFPAARLQPYYWTGTDWFAIPRSSTPVTIPCVCPEGDQTFYGYTVDAGAQTLTVTAAHSSVFGLAGSSGGGGGSPAPADAPTPPAAPPPDTTDSSPPPAATPPDPSVAAPSAPGDSSGGGHLLATLADGTPLSGNGSMPVSQPVLLSWQSDAGAQGVRFAAIAPDGTSHDLADGRWDPAQWPAGAYRLEAVGADGSTLGTVTVVSAAAPAALQTPAATAVAAAAASMAVLAGASLLSAAGVSVASAASQAASETAASMAEERFYESRLARAISRMRRLRLGPLGATLAALALVTLLFAWAAAGSWGGLPSFLLTVGVPSVAMFACCYALDWAIARSCGTPARLRLLGPGALALAVSTLGFRTPIGNPARVASDEEDGEGETAEDAARGWTPGDAAMAWASLLGYLAFAAPLALAGRWLGADVAAVGDAAIVSILATGTLPISPMTGSSLWHWRKSVALATWLGALALYVGYATGAVDDAAIAWLGLAALVPFVALLSAFALARRAQVPGWAAATGRGLLGAGNGLLRLVPFRRPAARISHAWDQAQERAGQAMRRGLMRLMLRRAPVAQADD